MESGFVKADSRNLPKVDSDMITYFFMENSDYTGVEIKGQKLIRSTRESYGDNAVGFVQIKRENQLCFVKGRITPEHKVRDKGYHVEVQIDENAEVIHMAKCYDCAAADGGCKHAVAFLLWLHRRSEEPSLTSVTCYWKKAKMALSSSSTAIIRARDMGEVPQVPSPDIDILSNFLARNSNSNCQASVLRYFNDVRDPLSLHKLCHFVPMNTAKDFLELIAQEMTDDRILSVFNTTKDQSASPLWFQLRYGRITGSILHEAAHCKTEDGSLVKKIMGEQSAFTTEAMKRGKLLENKVMEVVKEKEKIKQITNAGLMLSKDFPVLGATPDGMSQDYVIEIKCPFTEKSFRTYVVNGEINKKCWAQIQSQMYFLKKKMGLFCVAHPDFEETNSVDIYHVPYDEKILEILNHATEFWSKVVFPRLKNIYS